MFDDMDDTRADRALSAGLRTLLTSETSADFETRILASLVHRPPWWQTAWLAGRPAVSTALCALTVMLLLLHLAQQMPIGALPSQSSLVTRESDQRTRRAEAQGTTLRRSSLEPMDSIDLNSETLSFLSHSIRRNPG